MVEHQHVINYNRHSWFNTKRWISITQLYLSTLLIAWSIVLWQITLTQCNSEIYMHTHYCSSLHINIYIHTTLHNLYDRTLIGTIYALGALSMDHCVYVHTAVCVCACTRTCTMHSQSWKAWVSIFEHHTCYRYINTATITSIVWLWTIPYTTSANIRHFKREHINAP